MFLSPPPPFLYFFVSCQFFLSLSLFHFFFSHLQRTNVMSPLDMEKDVEKVPYYLALVYLIINFIGKVLLFYQTDDHFLSVIVLMPIIHYHCQKTTTNNSKQKYFAV